MDALGIPSCRPGKYFGEVARDATGPDTMVATIVPKDLVLGPHNEGDYWYKQPEFICFFCEYSDCTFGQTPLIHGANVARALPKDLMAKLENRSLKTEYVFRGLRESLRGGNKQKRNSWPRVFDTRERAKVESILDSRDDVTYHWNADDSLYIRVTTSIFWTHPVTGERCFRAMRYCDIKNVQFMMTHFARHQMPYFRFLLAQWGMNSVFWLMNRSWIRHEKYSWKTSFLEGPPLTDLEKKRLTRIFFDHCTIFRWHPRDVLIVDNIKAAHGRLNVDSSRKIHVFLSEYIEQGKSNGA
tara:strand:- start:924 stop:1817 length:894 start_codon:yes stop_codon:yes gene_type:complete